MLVSIESSISTLQPRAPPCVDCPHDFTERFPSIAQLVHERPAKSAAVDGEVVASNADGRPNFARLHVLWTRRGAIHLWAFDLLAFNGRDLRLQPLVKRQAVLQTLLERIACPAVSLSEPFENGLALLRVAEERGLEGVVSKRRDAPSAGIGARSRRSRGAMLGSLSRRRLGVQCHRYKHNNPGAALFLRISRSG